jgi:hypothetical protein
VGELVKLEIWERAGTVRFLVRALHKKYLVKAPGSANFDGCVSNKNVCRKLKD